MATKERENYLNLHVCIIEATKFLRFLFKNRWEMLFKNKWIDGDEESVSFFSINETGNQIRNSLKGVQYQLSLDTGISAQWDLHILSKILVSKPFSSLNNDQHIKNLKNVRNKICHMADMNVDDNEFDDLFDIISKSLKALGYKNGVLKENFVKQNPCIAENKEIVEDEFIKLGDLEFSRKNYVEALKMFTKAIDIYDLSNDQVADLYYKKSLLNDQLYKSIKPDTKYLYRSLIDAEKVVEYQPCIVRGYIQTADIASKLNLLEKAEEFYKKALSIDCGNENLKNSLANIRFKIGKQNRSEHLNPMHMPGTTEEKNEYLIQNLNDTMKTKLSQKSINEQRKALEKNNPVKKDVYLGHDYRDGSQKTTQSFEKAASYYGKAAVQNDPEALHNLALLHMKGLGVKLDYKTAIALLKQAANHEPENVIGVSSAEHTLGLVYEEGMGVDMDLNSAINWYEKAVKHKNGYSANNLACLYKEGKGIAQSFEIAEKLFILAYKLDNNDAMINLVELYILRNDPEHALVWHQRKINTKCIISINRNEMIMQEINRLKEWKTDLLRMNRKESYHIEKLKSIRNLRFAKISTPFDFSNVKYDFETLRDFAVNRGSSVAAKMIEAHKLFSKAISMVNNENFKVHDFISIMSEAYTSDSTLCSIEVSLRENVIKIIENFLKLNENKELDKKARICLMFLYKNNIDFITMSLSKHPKTKIMHQYRGTLYFFTKEWENALNDFETVSNLQPKSIDDEFSKANCYFKMEKFDLAIKSFKSFLSLTKSDNRNKPQAFYSTAISLIRIGEMSAGCDNTDEMIELHEKGLNSEKDLLPCYLPYKSTEKDELNLYMSMFKTLNGFDSQEKQFISRISITKDLNRVNLILEHREKQGALTDEKKSTISSSVKHLKITDIPSKFKEIFLREIDFARDYVMENSLINLTIIEKPLVLIHKLNRYFIQLIVADDLHFVEKVVICNYKGLINPENLQIGSRFSLTNPYIKKEFNRQALILVEDPYSVQLTCEILEKMCSFCGTKNSKFQCSKCHETNYCSKECQTFDCKVLKHNLICVQ